MRKLLDFDQDELILQDDTSGDEDEEEDDEGDNFKKTTVTVADATELVKSIEDSVCSLSDVIKGMDKRMKYNIKQFGDLMDQLENQRINHSPQ
jgi:hypothetical protein